MAKACTVLWAVTSDALTESSVAAFAERGLIIRQINTAQIASTSLIDVDVAVIEVSDSLDALNLAKTALASLGRDAPVVARVQRNQFELGIEIIKSGVPEVIPADHLEIDLWLSLVDRLAAKPLGESNYIFADPLSRNLLHLAQRVAKADVSVLLTGPTGAGKEVLARVLHDASDRASGPFVAFNCAAMPENLIEDMLFGHEKGSFTGAVKSQEGLFEQAQGGTIFLDEIGDMSYSLQAKLLRVLQERQLVRLGGQKAIELDIRVVAATNADLKNAIEARQFREDLYFRLSTFKLSLPCLSDRPGDIIPLVGEFVRQSKNNGTNYTITDQARSTLIAYSWPGNVRELQNVVARALILCRGNEISAEHLIFDDLGVHGGQEPSSIHVSTSMDRQISRLPEAGASDLGQTVKDSECQAIMAALNSAKNRNEAAQMLGISPRTLRHKLQKFREQGASVARAYAR